ncbi:MAG: methyltransferase domain-containing protein [Gammaproteobacteria bacterium]|nr:MAG: methyltransferase domain-containing protein [Gammaproteobacteria bacterium]
MLKTVRKMDEALLLRRCAAKGDFQQVQEILNRNKTNPDFNIDAQSSNGNTALHWACFYAKELHQGFSEKYSEIIRLLIENAADHQVKNKRGKIPPDFLQGMHENVPKDFSSQDQIQDSCYFSLIQTLLRLQCVKITIPEELKGELAHATTFYFIIDSLKLFDFFPPINDPQKTITVLSLGCGISSEIFPLMMYFHYQNKQVNYIGIDNNKALIEDNKRRYAAYENIKFICADATNLDEINIHIDPNSIDLGILRNGDFSELWKRQKIFGKIIDEIFPCVLKPNFPLLLSFQTREELEICTQKTQVLQNFKKFKSNNFCDVGTLCLIFGQVQNKTVFTYSDRFTAILNVEKTAEDEQMPLSHFRQLSV